MGIIDTLRAVFRPTRRQDPVFGSMHLMRGRRPYWECKVTFPPTSSVIEAFVDGSETDSLERQHAFFAQLVEEWPHLSEEIGKMLLEKLGEWERNLGKSKPEYRTKSPWTAFELSSVRIPDASLDEAKWEASFTNLAEPSELWTVFMLGRKPVAWTMDD